MVGMATMDRIPADVAAGEGRIERLERAGVELVELSFVDNAGITRVKAVPLGRLAAAASTGVGASPCFETFGSDDVMVPGRYLGGPDGDLRLVPDLDRAVALVGAPGWAWAPVDKFTQDGARFVACQRAFAARQAAAAEERGLTLRMAIEHEWILGGAAEGTEGFTAAFEGPAYGQIRLERVAGYARELVVDLLAQDIAVEQFHPEYATAQLELSVAAADPVSAADDAVLVRHSVRTRSLRHGWRASFAPSVDPDGAGSGAHLHLSVHDGEGSAMSGGAGPAGLRPPGEAFLAGVLRELPALVAVGAGHPASFLRLQPSRWAGVWQCWGVETRETALDKDQSSLAALNIRGLLTLNAAYALAMAATAITVYVFGLLLQRRREYVTMRALGVRGGLVRALLVTEAGGVAVLGAAAGVLAGVAMAFFLVRVLRPSFVLRPVVVLPVGDVAILTGLVVAVSVLAALAATVLVNRLPATELLRDE